jgi:hypothetical protein
MNIPLFPPQETITSTSEKKVHQYFFPSSQLLPRTLDPSISLSLVKFQTGRTILSSDTKSQDFSPINSRITRFITSEANL